jgi:hydrogenase maturation protease
VTLAEELAPLLARPWLLVGVGSDLRGDDAFGPLLARRLAEEGFPALDAATSPESLTGPILRSGAEVLILADVGSLGAPPGTLRLLPAAAVPPGGTSTHDPGLGLLVAYLEAQRPLTVRILAVEPARMGLGVPVSPEVAAAVDRAAGAVRAAGARRA